MDDLEFYRRKIDSLDERIIALLAERFSVVRDVGKLKAAQGLHPVQLSRVDAVLERVQRLAVAKKIDPAFVKVLYARMIQYAHEIEFHQKAEHERKKA